MLGRPPIGVNHLGALHMLNRGPSHSLRELPTLPGFKEQTIRSSTFNSASFEFERILFTILLYSRLRGKSFVIIKIILIII